MLRLLALLILLGTVPGEAQVPCTVNQLTLTCPGQTLTLPGYTATLPAPTATTVIQSVPIPVVAPSPGPAVPVYFSNAPWILIQQGAVTPQFLDVRQWVPSTATRFTIQVVFFTACSLATGYIDASVNIRIDPFTNYATPAMMAGIHFPAQWGICHDVGGTTVTLPNTLGGFYWLIQGTTLQAGANVTMSLLSYE